VKASESAYEASELLREQLSLVSREKDLACMQVEELRTITMRCQLEEAIRECQHCRKFFLESENIGSPCHWHPGKVGCLNSVHTVCNLSTVFLSFLVSILAVCK